MNGQTRILIIDDNQLMSVAHERVLKREGYQVAVAFTGEEGLQELAQQLPDLVLLDRVLPDMDGIEICRQIKSDPKTAGVLIIMISGYKISSDEQAGGLETGADVYMTRPITHRQLIAQVDAMIRIKNAERRVEHLHRVLRAIANVNQHIAREKDPGLMLQGACDLLVEKRGYHHIWILMFDDNQVLTTAIQAGNDAFDSLERVFIRCGELPECGRQALQLAEVVVSHDPDTCPLIAGTSNLSAITIRINYREKIFGILCASIPTHFANDEEEHFLLKEVAEDIAFALYESEQNEQRQRANDALEESERKLATLLRNLPGMAYRWPHTPQLTPMFVSEGCMDLTGYTVTKFTGENPISFADLIHPEERQMVMDAMQDALDSDKPFAIEYRIQHKNGGFRWVSDRGSVVGIDDSGVSILEGFISDITDRKFAEASVSDLARFPDENPNPVLRVAKGGAILYANPGSQQLLEHWNTRVDDRVPDDWCVRIQDAIATNEVQTVQLIVASRVFSFITAPIPMAGYVNIYGMDVTLRVENEEKLKRRNAEVEALFLGARAVLQHRDFSESAQVIFNIAKSLIGATAGYLALVVDDTQNNDVLFLDSGGLPCSVDPDLPMPTRGLRALAYEEHRAVYDNSFSTGEWIKYIPAEHMALRNAMFAPLIIEEKPAGVLGFANKPDGFNENDAIMATAFGELASIALLNSRTFESLKESEHALRDYSESLEDRVVERTQQLQSAQEQLVRREKLALLGQLAGSVGHELRNPLSVIKNAVYYLNMVHGKSDPKTREMLQTIDTEIGVSNKIIGSLLDYARAKPPMRSSVYLEEVLQQSISRTIPADLTSVKVVLMLDPNLPVIPADSNQLIQVFSNLISNAVQAMPDGGILTLQSEYEKDIDSICISISDTGTGISPEHLEVIFEPLFTTKAKGIGLGLALVKTIIEGHQGSIEAHSQPGVGTTFSIHLPLN